MNLTAKNLKAIIMAWAREYNNPNIDSHLALDNVINSENDDLIIAVHEWCVDVYGSPVFQIVEFYGKYVEWMFAVYGKIYEEHDNSDTAFERAVFEQVVRETTL